MPYRLQKRHGLIAQVGERRGDRVSLKYKRKTDQYQSHFRSTNRSLSFSANAESVGSFGLGLLSTKL